MEDEEPSRPLKKRRIPKACAACRRSKLRCDEQRPCARCANASVECVYAERPVDPNTARFQRLEDEIRLLKNRLDATGRQHGTQQSPSASYSTEAASDYSLYGVQLGRVTSHFENNRPTTQEVTAALRYDDETSTIAFSVRTVSSIDVVSCGLVTEADAQQWFATFLDGCLWFVSVLDLGTDNYSSIRSRSCILFDTILIIGARAAHGPLSKQYQALFPLLRQRTSDLVLRLSTPSPGSSIEDIQALLIIAAYSDGAILCDVALKASLAAGLPNVADDNLSDIVRAASHKSRAVAIAPATRVWYYVYVLDMILSLDGGKPASIEIQQSAARRVRMLASHPGCTAPDVRLFAQVELNTIRSVAHASIAKFAYGIGQGATSGTLRGISVDLDLWLSEWLSLVSGLGFTTSQHTNIQLNLRIQNAWAKLVLNLRALTASGIDNIALMTEEQRALAVSAKDAAERHLQLVMTSVSSQSTNNLENDSIDRPYVSSFRYAMEFVWAKNSFCVLIVLRLNILLGASVDHLVSRLFEAKAFLAELERVGMGASVSYNRILTQIVDKCERAVNSSLRNAAGETDRTSDNDFETFLPKEFMFEWDFPGVHLHYIPLDWQDLLFDIGIVN